METVFTAKFSARDSVANNCDDRRTGSLSNYYDGRNEYMSRPSRYNYQNAGYPVANSSKGYGDNYIRPQSRPSVRRNLVQSAIETTSVIGNRTIVNGVLVNSDQPGASNQGNGTQFSFEINYPENSNVNHSNSNYQPFTQRTPSAKGRVSFQEDKPSRIALENPAPIRNLAIERNEPYSNALSSKSTDARYNSASLVKQNSDESDDFSQRSDEDLVKMQTIVVIDKDPLTNKINHIKEAFRLDNNMDNLEYDQISEYKSNYDGQNQPVININETIKFNRIPDDQSRTRSSSRGDAGALQQSAGNRYGDPSGRASFRKQLFESTIETTSVLNNSTAVVEAPFKSYLNK